MDPVQLTRLALENDDYELLYMLFVNERVPRGVSFKREWRRFNLNSLTDDQCWFVSTDIVRLSALLALPPVIRVSNGCVCDRLDALCMVLRRFVYPNRLCELESLFGRPTSSLSLIVNETRAGVNSVFAIQFQFQFQ